MSKRAAKPRNYADAVADAAEMYQQAIREGRQPQTAYCLPCGLFGTATYPNVVYCPGCKRPLLMPTKPREGV